MTPANHRLLRPRYHHGFTLLETAVVLVIVGLLVGGVMVAQNMARSSKVMAIITDFQRYNQAAANFQTKYTYLPGDLPTAGNYWGLANADANLCKTTLGSGKSTCNGNGDGMVTSPSTADYDYEAYRFWQQLSNARMIEGSYTGIANGSPKSLPGTNVPAANLDGGGFTMHFKENDFTGADANYYPATYNHAFYFGNHITSYNTGKAIAGPIITPQEAWVIDSKIDDALPGLGNVMSWKMTSAVAPNCTNSDTASSAAYNLSNSARLCSLIIRTGY